MVNVKRIQSMILGKKLFALKLFLLSVYLWYEIAKGGICICNQCRDWKENTWVFEWHLSIDISIWNTCRSFSLWNKRVQFYSRFYYCYTWIMWCEKDEEKRFIEICSKTSKFRTNALMRLLHHFSDNTFLRWPVIYL